MSIGQDIAFGSAHLKDRKYDKDAAIICDCGKVTIDHTLRERRVCLHETTLTREEMFRYGNQR